ncbi:MAG TPA: TraR/DksA family transcriptional regulator [bacterium]|nr:TraR/DksA family transcriptional regulator [bacterium]
MAGSKKKTTTKKNRVAKKPIKKNAIHKIAQKNLRVVVARVVPKKIRISPVFQPLLVKLQRRRNEITGQVNHLEQDLREDIADNQNMPGDSADHGSGELNQHLSVTLMENDRIELERIERAILRIESGAYGKCETCEKIIPMPRLKAIPWATRCISCQSRVESV